MSPSNASFEEANAYTLVLENISKSVTRFSERPNRSIGSETTSEFINRIWPNRFAAIPPNAVLDCLMPGETLEDGMYITLESPTYDSENDRLTFAAITLHNWTMAEKPETERIFTHVKLTLLPNCINTGQTCWSWAQLSPLVRLIPSNEDGQYRLEMNHIYRELYHLQHAPKYGSEIMSTVSMATNWNDIFEGIPPNASLSAYTGTGELNLLLLTLNNPSYDATDDRFTYEATVLSGDAALAESMHTATLLIDSTGPVDYQKAANQGEKGSNL